MYWRPTINVAKLNNNRIPYEKALEFANREKITDILYPLFVHDISRVMTVQGSSNADHPRGLDVSRLRARAATSKDPVAQSPIGPSSLSTIAQVTGSRPAVERSHTFPTPPSHTFPTPPASASSVIGGQSNSYEWNNSQNMNGNVQPTAPLAIDTTLSNSRSLPNTPASTPPGTNVQSMQPYQQHSSHSQYGMPQVMPRYNHSGHYIKSEMGPPMKTSAAESDSEVKHDPYNHSNTDTPDVTHDNGYSRNHYLGGYSSIVENAITSPEQVNGSSPHQTAGHITPRTSIHTQWSDYNTPPRSNTTYETSSNGGSSYTGAGYTPNTLASLKRNREDDDIDYKRPSIGGDLDALKRRRGTEPSVAPLSSYDHNRHNQPGNTIMPRTR